MLVAYRALGRKAAAAGSARYPLKPKHHLAEHINDEAQLSGVCPGRFWCFQEEDAMKVYKRMSVQAHASSAARRGLDRWLTHFSAEADFQ